MRAVILDKLKEIEESNDVTILYACESGSRAWGFASPDSDFDVRFIYAHKADHYLSIDTKRDVIELPVNEILDISGWDIKKALVLFRKTNATIYEWLQSPIIYQTDNVFQSDLLALMPGYFAPRPGFHHYINMASGCLQHELQGDEVKMKKYFYALRPILAAKWIIDKQTVPPMEFHILRTLIAESNIQEAIDQLLEQKIVADEKVLIKPNPLLHAFISDTINYCNDKKDSLKDIENSTEPLNILFRKTIGIHGA